MMFVLSSMHSFLFFFYSPNLYPKNILVQSNSKVLHNVNIFFFFSSAIHLLWKYLHNYLVQTIDEIPSIFFTFEHWTRLVHPSEINNPTAVYLFLWVQLSAKCSISVSCWNWWLLCRTVHYTHQEVADSFVKQLYLYCYYGHCSIAVHILYQNIHLVKSLH